jgi:hypothetical protein
MESPRSFVIFPRVNKGTDRGDSGNSLFSYTKQTGFHRLANICRFIVVCAFEVNGWMTRRRAGALAQYLYF